MQEDDHGLGRGSATQNVHGVSILAAIAGSVRGSLTRKFALTMVLVNIAVTAALGWELLGRDRAALDYNRLTRAHGVAGLLAAGAGPAVASRDPSALLRLAQSALDVSSVETVSYTHLRGPRD